MLISLSLGVILSGAVLQAASITRKNLVTQHAIARIAENIRTVDYILGTAVRTSGNLGCSRIRPELAWCVHEGVEKSYRLEDKKPLLPIQNQFVNAKLKGANNSDVLWINSIKPIRRFGPQPKDGLGYFLVQNSKKFKENKIIIISDCMQADVFKIKHIEHSEVKSTTKIYFGPPHQTLSKRYSEDAQIGMLRSDLYYVAKTSRLNSNHQPIWSLYRKNLNGQTVELVEGVECMRVKYGIFKNNTIVYSNEPALLEDENIISIKIAMLFNSIEEGITSAAPCLEKENVVTHADKLIRKWIEFEWMIPSVEKQI